MKKWFKDFHPAAWQGWFVSAVSLFFILQIALFINDMAMKIISIILIAVVFAFIFFKTSEDLL